MSGGNGASGTIRCPCWLAPSGFSVSIIVIKATSHTHFESLVQHGVKRANLSSQCFTMILRTIEENPYPGQIFNHPTADGVPGWDVYADCQKDYTQDDVTVHQFLGVITGNKTAAGGRVLRVRPRRRCVFSHFLITGV